MRRDRLCQSKAAPNLKDVKAFQGAGHVNRTGPHGCPDGPLAMETSLHLEAWRTKCPMAGWQYALDFEVQYASVRGICLNISEFTGHRWDTNSNWRDLLQGADLLSLCNKRLPRLTPCLWMRKPCLSRQLLATCAARSRKLRRLTVPLTKDLSMRHVGTWKRRATQLACCSCTAVSHVCRQHSV